VGTLLGFQDVFAAIEPLSYSVNALSRAVFLSITRGQLKDLLGTYVDDKVIFQRAIEHANVTIKGGNRRLSSTPKEDLKAAGNKVVAAQRLSQHLTQDEVSLLKTDAPLIRPTTGEKASSPAVKRPRAPTNGNVAEESAGGGAEGVAPSGAGGDAGGIQASSEQIEHLMDQVDSLTQLTMVQAKMMKVLFATISGQQASPAAQTEGSWLSSAGSSGNNQGSGTSANEMRGSAGGPGTNIDLMNDLDRLMAGAVTTIAASN